MLELNVGCEVAHGLDPLPPASRQIFHGALCHPICSALTRLGSLRLCLEYSFIYSYSSFTSQLNHDSSEEEASLGVRIASLVPLSLVGLCRLSSISKLTAFNSTFFYDCFITCILLWPEGSKRPEGVCLLTVASPAPAQSCAQEGLCEMPVTGSN